MQFECINILIIIVLTVAAECSTSAKTSKTIPQTQTLKTCIEAGSKWAKNSQEYAKRLSAVQNMLIGTAYPIAMVDQPDFKQMVHTLDPKFTLPGIY
jgi:hypothetical protein